MRYYFSIDEQVADLPTDKATSSILNYHLGYIQGLLKAMGIDSEMTNCDNDEELFISTTTKRAQKYLPKIIRLLELSYRETFTCDKEDALIFKRLAQPTLRLLSMCLLKSNKLSHNLTRRGG